MQDICHQETLQIASLHTRQDLNEKCNITVIQISKTREHKAITKHNSAKKWKGKCLKYMSEDSGSVGRSHEFLTRD